MSIIKKKRKAPSSLVARPVRKKHSISPITRKLLPYFPEIKKKIELADLKITPKKFLDQVVLSTILLSLALYVLFFLLFDIFYVNMLLLIPLIFVIPVLVFWYLMLYLDVSVIKRRKKIDYELVFAMRHLIIALRSGMPIFDALVGISVGYGELSREFNKIVEKVTLGVPLSQALRESAQKTPSKDFSRVLMQIANSISSGSDVADSLESVVEQISKNQILALKTYGRKLTPFVMFFMIFGIILPSLGIAFAVILLSLISGNVFENSSFFLISIFLFILLVQYLFLAMVEGSRPHYAL